MFQLQEMEMLSITPYEEGSFRMDNDDIIKIPELIRLSHVQSGRVTTDNDREVVRTLLINFKRYKDEKFDQFVDRRGYLLDRKIDDVGLDDIKHSTKFLYFFKV